MIGQSDEKYVLEKGTVNELIRIYELNCSRQEVLRRSKTESSLIRDEPAGLSSDKCIGNTNRMFIKNKCEQCSSALASVGQMKRDESSLGRRTSSTIKHTQSEIEGSTSTIPRVAKKPLPAPRAHHQPQDIKNINDEPRSNHLTSIETIPSTTFREATKFGNIESLRKSLLLLFDEEISKMKIDGYEDTSNGLRLESLNRECDNSYSEDEFASDKNREESSSELDFPNDATYVNLTELLGYKEGKQTYEVDPNYENILQDTKEESMYERIGEFILNDNEFEASLSEINHNKCTTGTVDVSWNIPPSPDRSLKPAKYIDECKKKSLYYDETDDENYESIIENRKVETKPKELTAHESRKHNLQECDNPLMIQSTKLPKIIHEFKQTEKRYIQELIEIIPVYKYAIKNHSSVSIQNKAALICATIDKLLEIQTQFGSIVKKSDDSIEVILRIFMDFEELFITYKQYLGTTDSITVTVGYNENDFKKQINLPSILSQRLTHYEMFLERVRKEVAQELNSEIFQVVLCSLNTVIEIITSCNTMLLLATVKNSPLRTNKYGSLNDVREAPASNFVQCCPFDVSGYGDFLLKDKFKTSRPFTMELTVFLFNNIMLFTMEEQKDKFYYHSHIKMNDVQLKPLKKRDVLEFQHFRKSKQFHAPTNYKLKSDPRVVKKWRKNLDDCLWTQKLKIKEEVTEQYKKPVVGNRSIIIT